MTVQHVPDHIYGRAVRYPAWFLSRGKLLRLFSRRYSLFTEFDAIAGAIHLSGATAHDRGFVFDLLPSSKPS